MIRNHRHALTAFAAVFALAIAMLGVTFTASAEGSPGNEGVCAGDHQYNAVGPTHTYTAPLGLLVSGYCVKAGSIKQGNGPEYVTVDPPAASVTFSHSSGKDISHYTVTLVAVPTEEPTPTETVTPTPTETVTPTPNPEPTETVTETPDPTETPTVTPTVTEDPKPVTDPSATPTPEVSTTTGSVTVTPTVTPAPEAEQSEQAEQAEPEKGKPEKGKPNKHVLMTQCINGTGVITRDGKVIGGGGTCAEDTEPEPLVEEGL